MENIGFACSRPEPEKIRAQAEEGAHPFDFLDPGWFVWGVHLDHFDLVSISAQQIGELPALIGHSAKGRWQGADQTNAQRSHYFMPCMVVEYVCIKPAGTVSAAVCKPSAKLIAIFGMRGYLGWNTSIMQGNFFFKTAAHLPKFG